MIVCVRDSCFLFRYTTCIYCNGAQKIVNVNFDYRLNTLDVKKRYKLYVLETQDDSIGDKDQ